MSEELSLIPLSASSSSVCNHQAVDLPSQITFKSSDGIVFNQNINTLDLFCGAFPKLDHLTISEEAVTMSESSYVLRLLFQFNGRQPCPDLANVSIETLLELSEAAEKYQAFSAMAVCMAFLRYRFSEDSVGVLNFSVKHDKREIVQEAARASLSYPTKYVRERLDPVSLLAWYNFRESVMDIRESFDVDNYRGPLHKGGDMDCTAWHSFSDTVRDRLAEKQSAILNISTILRKASYIIDGCSQCRKRCSRILSDGLVIDASKIKFVY